MFASAFLVIAIGVQLLFLVDGNCTTELDETSEVIETSSPSGGLESLGEDASDSAVNEQELDNDIFKSDRKAVKRESNQGLTMDASSAFPTAAPASESDELKNSSAFGSNIGEVEIPDKAPDYDYLEARRKRLYRDTNDHKGIADERNATSSNIPSSSTQTNTSDIHEKNNSSLDSNQAKNEKNSEQEPEYDYVNTMDKKRLERDTNTELMITNTNNATFVGISTQRNISTTDRSLITSEDGDSAVNVDSGTAVPREVMSIPEMIYKRVDRDTITNYEWVFGVTNMVADETTNSSSSSSIDVEKNSSAFDIQNLAPTKKKLKKFPSLQYIARHAVSEIKTITRKPVKGELEVPNIFREKRELIAPQYHYHRADLSKSSPNQNWLNDLFFLPLFLVCGLI